MERPNLPGGTAMVHLVQKWWDTHDKFISPWNQRDSLFDANVCIFYAHWAFISCRSLWRMQIFARKTL